MLAQIVRGREAATERVALKVARALDKAGKDCLREAHEVREAVNGRST